MGLIRGQASLSGQSRRLPHALLVAAVVLDVGYVIALADANGLAGTVATFWLSHATQWVPVALFWIVAMNARIHRPEVVLAAAAVTFSALGDSYYSIAMGSDGYLHSPSVADIGYLMFYPLMLCSIGVFARRQTARVDRAVMLDAAVASLGAAALVAVLLSPLLGDALTGTSVLTMVVNIAYPLFDLILIAAVVGIAASPTVDAGRRWKGLVAGLLVFTAADIVYALLDHVGAYVSDTPLDALWAVGLTLIAWWIHGLAAPDLSEVTPQRPHSTHISLPVTAFGYIAGLGVLLYGAQVPVSGLALGLATATVALAALPVIFRQALLSRMLSEKQRVLDEFDRLDRSKSEMLETMNHELRTPLTSIVGYLEVVRDGGGGRIPAAADDMLAV
ncbi:MAG TPA: histidine kinase dimerization/phospho-acceptor domain-containing protein, partial [Glaciihabitans sp.]|nr:histidine kinase dimerization/phospho-acceptor domain-containing protein [Glaciihabitans sp.]